MVLGLSFERAYRGLKNIRLIVNVGNFQPMLEQVEKDIKTGKNISDPFSSATEIMKHLDNI